MDRRRNSITARIDRIDMSFMEAWHSPKFQALRQANLDENVCGTVCEKCIAY